MLDSSFLDGSRRFVTEFRATTRDQRTYCSRGFQSNRNWFVTGCVQYIFVIKI